MPGSLRLWLYPSLRQQHVSPRQPRERQASHHHPRARALEAKLWGGFSSYALKDLEELKRSVHADRKEVSYAAWALARWYAAEWNWERAYENVLVMRHAKHSKTNMRQVLLEVECLIRLGQRGAARTLLSEAMRHRQNNSSLHLAMANTYAPLDGPGDAESDAVRLSWINRIYQSADLVPIAKADPSRPLALDNLAGATACATAVTVDQPKVTVIMPVFSGETTLAVSLRSVLAQTWRNLEVIVVDDCSPDDTFAVAEAFARRDPRVRAIRLENNRGAYVARNRGLELATGELVTTHDADDWSHPQKIEQQMRNVLENRDFIGNLTTWVRVFPYLWVNRSLWKNDSYVHTNSSSLLAGRDTLNAIGGWDRVRITADTELIWRLTRYADRKPVTILDRIPMSFALDARSSLTNAGATHFRTIYHGVRREYREAAAHWHSSVGAPDKLKLCDDVERPFPAPGMILSNPDDPVKTDLLVITDFNLEGGAVLSALADIRAALSCGLSVAVFHWRRYDLDVTAPLNAEIRRMAQAARVRIIAPGERVRARTVIVGSPAILQYAIDLCPKVDFDSFVIRVDQATAHPAPGDVQYDPLQVRQNLSRLFGTEGVWAPISERAPPDGRG